MSGVQPIPLQMIQRLDDPSLMLRLNQRITAEILQVANDQVLLALQGTRIVARLTSSDQAASLQQQQIAQFRVRGFENGVLKLQLAGTEATSVDANQVAPELIPSILRQQALPDDPQTVLLADALLAHGQAITPNAIQALRDALSAFNQWGSEHAHAAASLFAEGVPLTAETILLNVDASKPVYLLVSELTQLLSRLSPDSLSENGKQWLYQALTVLQSASVDLAGEEDPAIQLQRYLNLVTRPLEHDLIRAQNKSASPLSENILHALMHLRSALSPQEHPALLTQLDQTIEALNRSHLMNIPRATSSGEMTPLNYSIPILLPGASNAAREKATARLRIAREPAKGSDTPEMPAHVHLRVELPLGGIDINLTFHSQRVGALVATNSEILHEAAESELPSLAVDLEKQGFVLSQSRCVLDSLEDVPDRNNEAWSSPSAVDVEV